MLAPVAERQMDGDADGLISPGSVLAGFNSTNHTVV